MAYSESMKPKHTNPFTATLGATPPLLVGRSDAIDDFGFALDEGPGAHERISLIIGPPGFPVQFALDRKSVV